MSNHTTPAQTVGPYLHIGLPWPDGPYAVTEGTAGAVWIRGTVTDGAGEPVGDALVETWQADPDGRFDHPDDPRGARSHPGFRGFGRCPTDVDGTFGILTLKPGSVPGPNGPRRHTSTCRCSRAACCIGWSPACTFPRKRRPTPPTPS